MTAKAKRRRPRTKIAGMPLHPGTHVVGPESGTMQVMTYREGMAQKVGHDLVLDVSGWQARVTVGEDRAPTTIELDVDPRSLQVREGKHGVKPLSDGDRDEIRKNIDEKVLRGQPIEFRSRQVSGREGALKVNGELTIAGQTRPAGFELELNDYGELSGTLTIVQSQWDIKPYRALMGALKVRDAVEIALEVRLPAD